MKFKFNLYTLLFLILLSIFSMSVYSESSEESINSRITSINSQIEALPGYLQNEEPEIAKTRLKSLNQQLNAELTSLYFDIVKIREVNPSFNPKQIIEYPDELKPSFYENLNEKLRDKYYDMKSEFEKAKYDFGLVKFKTAMAVVLNAAIVYNDAMGMAGTTGKDLGGTIDLAETALNQIVNYQIGDLTGKLLDPQGTIDKVKILKNNIDALQEEGAKYDEYVKEFYDIKKHLLKQHHYLSRVISSMAEISNELEDLQNLIDNARNHINSASSASVFDVDETSLSSSEFITAFNNNLNDLENGDISWDEYFSQKSNIYYSFRDIRDNIIDSGKSEENQDAINQIFEHYNTFDEFEVNKREEILNEFQVLLSDWQESYSDVINYYNSINTDDIDPVDIEPIRTEYNFEGHYTQEPSHTIGPALAGVNYGLELDINSLSGNAWYQELFSHCDDISTEIDKIYGIANSAVESSGEALDSGKKFSVLLYDVEQMKDGLTNMKRYRDYLAYMPSYLESKVKEIKQISSKLQTLENDYNEIISLQDSNPMYLTYVDVCVNSQVCETEQLIESIEYELEDIELMANNIDTTCYYAQDYVDDMIDKQEDFIAFTSSFADEVDNLKNKMQKHSDFLNTLNELKDAEQAYQSLLSYKNPSQIQGNYDYLKQYYEKFKNYEDLEDFIEVQKEIEDIRSKIKADVTGFSSYGFEGDYAILDSDRQKVQELVDMSFFFGGYYTEDNLKAGVPEIQNLLDGNNVEETGVSEIASAANGLENNLEMIKAYQGDDESIRSFYMDSHTIWNTKVLGPYAKNKGWEKGSQEREDYKRARDAYENIINIVQPDDVEEQFSMKRFIPDESLANPIDSVLLELYSGQLEGMGLSDFRDRWQELQDEKYADYDDTDETYGYGDYYYDDNFGYDDGEAVAEPNYDDNDDWFAWTSVWDTAYDFSDGHGADHCGPECYSCDVSCYNCESGECFVCEESCYDCDASCFDPNFSGWDEDGEWLGPDENDKDDKENDDEEDSQLVEEIQDFMKEIQIGLVLPKFVPYTNEIFNIYTLDGEDVGYIKLENKTIKEYDFFDNEDYTYEIYVKDASIIKKIAYNESPLDRFNEYKSSGDLVIKGKSFGSKVKTTVISVFAKIASWFF